VTTSYLDLRGRNHLHVLSDENARFIAAARKSGWSSAVAACPGWNVAELVFHMCKVQAMFHGMLSTGATSPKDLPRTERPASDDGLVELFTAGAARLEHLLESTADDAPVWTFIGTQPAAWVKRRMAHEVLVHRFDAEIAGGALSQTDEVVCADGIDEKFGVFLPWFGDKVTLTNTVHLHCSDTDGEWMLGPGAGSVRVAREHGKGDVAFNGPSQILLLALWRRISIDEAVDAGAKVFGDRAVLDAFVTAFGV
jgi:uncharacterized protein (TIGR03083 family)